MGWMHLRDETPKARKAYRCYLCRREIAVGETHVKRSGVGDDGPESVRMHQACEAKTWNWGEDEWEGHEPAEFRQYELGEAN